MGVLSYEDDQLQHHAALLIGLSLLKKKAKTHSKSRDQNISGMTN